MNNSPGSEGCKCLSSCFPFTTLFYGQRKQLAHVLVGFTSHEDAWSALSIPEILFTLRTAARVLLLEDHCGDSALWPQPESEPSFAEHSLSSLCTARQGRAEMDRQSQASARVELRAPFASTIPADLGATSGLGCLPLLEAQC